MHSYKTPTTKTTTSSSSSSSQKRQSTESQPELLQAPPRQKKNHSKTRKTKQKQTHKWKREKTNWNFLLTKQAKSRRGLMMRAAAPFSFFSFRRKQTKRKKKQPKTSLPKSPNFKASPTPNSECKRQNTYGKIQNWVVMKTSLFLMMRRSMKKQANKQTNKQPNKEAAEEACIPSCAFVQEKIDTHFSKTKTTLQWSI